MDLSLSQFRTRILDGWTAQTPIRFLGGAAKELTRKFIRFENCFLYQTRLDSLPAFDSLRIPQGFKLEIVHGNQEADRIGQGRVDLRQRVSWARSAIEAGAVAFCLFDSEELANLGWIALSQEAKQALRQLPYKVNFNRGEACTGGLWTHPRYRGRGLARFNYGQRCHYLARLGCLVSKNAVARRNLAIQSIVEEFGGFAYARARRIAVAGWTRWDCWERIRPSYSESSPSFAPIEE